MKRCSKFFSRIDWESNDSESNGILHWAGQQAGYQLTLAWAMPPAGIHRVSVTKAVIFFVAT